tara:strand:- start:469 stop:810 length:342 start_codon:yes stop_codon:yes gene_type:complete
MQRAKRTMGSSLYFIGIFFILLGLAIKHLKWHNAIAGYNTLSEKEKKKIDINKIATVFRNIMVAMGLLYIAAQLASLYYKDASIAEIAFFIITPVGAVLSIILLNSDKFRKNG